MNTFLKEIIEGKQLELHIDTKIFSKDIVLKAAYNFLDKGYFFFKLDEQENMVLQFTAKDWININPKELIWNFTESLLEVHLRNKLEIDNKIIRETIVSKAINWTVDAGNFVTLDQNSQQQSTVDFDKDIDDILKEIENDPELKIDEQEIEKILKEIEEESKKDVEKPAVVVDPNAIKNAKKKFQG